MPVLQVQVDLLVGWLLPAGRQFRRRRLAEPIGEDGGGQPLHVLGVFILPFRGPVRLHVLDPRQGMGCPALRQGAVHTVTPWLSRMAAAH